MDMKTIAFIFSFTLLLTACGTASEKEMASTDTTTSLADVVPDKPTLDLYSDGRTKMIKEAHYRFQVKSVKSSTEAIEKAVKKFPGYIAASSLRLENPTLESKVTIKVQNQYFYDLLKEIDKEAVFVNFRNVSTEDVSKQFVDLESRLKSKREVEQRLMDILRHKAGTVKDVLEAEKQIGDLHEEIEAVISQINFLKDQVSYSTIDLEYYQTVSEVIAENETTFLNDVADAAKSGAKGLASFIVGMIYVWPLILFAIAATVWLKQRKMFLVKPKA
jgi:hypothetical protein